MIAAIGRDTHLRYRKCNEPPKGLRQISRCIDGQAEAVREINPSTLFQRRISAANRSSERSGVSLSRVLVESALTDGVLTNERREEAEVAFFLREWAIFEVARDNNLNQIARQLNSQRGVISTERIEEVLTATS